MYQVYVNGEPFGSSNTKDLIDPQVKVEVNKAGTFQCSILPTHKFYNRLIKMTSFVEVFQNNDRIFSGRLLNTEADSYGQMSCYFEGDFSYFIDSVQEPGLYEESIRERFLRLIDAHNLQVEPRKQFLPGVIEIDEADEENLFQDSSYSDTRSLLDSLIEDYGGYFVVRHFGGVTYLDYLKEYDKRSSQKLQFRKNILDIQQYISGEDLFTVLLPLADEPDEEDISETAVGEELEDPNDPYEKKILTIESVNNGSKYIEIEELVDIFGRIVKIQTFENAKSPQDLLNMANQYIEDISPGLTDTLTITALDDSFINKDQKPIHLGNLVEIFYQPLNLKKVMTCVSIDYDLANPENTVYQFGILKQDLSGKYSSTINVYENYTQNNNRTIEYHNKIINHIEQDLIVNARNIEINAQDILINSKNIEINAQDILINSRDIEINARNIAINAEKIEANAKDIVLNAERIAAIAEEILLYARKDYVDEIEGRTTSLEAYIKLLPGIIEMMATKSEVDALGNTLRNEASIIVDGINAKIDLKASSESVSALESRISQAEVEINGKEGYIGLKTLVANLNDNLEGLGRNYDELSKLVDEVGESVSHAELRIDAAEASIKAVAGRTTVLENEQGEIEKRVTNAELDIDGANAAIKLKADATVTTALGERVTSAEININGLKGEIELKASSSTVTALSGKVATAESSIRLLQGQIELKASTTTVDNLTKTVNTVKADLDSSNATITLHAQSIQTLDTRTTNMSESVSAAWLAINGMDANIQLKVNKNGIISSINLSPEEITIQSKKVNLVGYVTAETLEAEIAKIDNFFNGFSMISTAYVNYINCQGSMSFKGTFLKWDSASVMTSLPSLTPSTFHMTYKDANGINQSVDVVTSIAFNRGSLSTINYLGQQ